MDIETAFRNTAGQGRAAQMVRYVIDQPVDLGAGRSAALPVFASELPARLLTICNELDSELPPMHAIEFTNTTGLPIVSGPLSVIREGDFVGDGKLPRMAVDEKTEVVYGADRAVNFERDNHDPVTTLKSVRIDRDVVVLEAEHVEKRTYRFVNEDPEKRDIVLYCPRGAKARSDVSPLPDRDEQSELRFLVEVEPQSSKELEVVFTKNESEKKVLSEITPDILEQWLKLEVRLSDDDQAFFRRLFAIDARIVEVVSEQEKLASRRQDLLSEQARMRENVQALSENRDAAQPFIDKLLQMEQQVDDLTQQQTEVATRLKQIRDERQGEINAYQ
jgi:hypothetical protein